MRGNDFRRKHSVCPGGRRNSFAVDTVITVQQTGSPVAVVEMPLHSAKKRIETIQNWGRSSEMLPSCPSYHGPLLEQRLVFFRSDREPVMLCINIPSTVHSRSQSGR